MPVPLGDEEYRSWAEWLAEEYGMRWGPEKREILRSRLEPRRAATGSESFEQLLFLLRFAPDGEAEREHLVAHLTNNESYFCRERDALEVIRTEIFPALAAAAGGGGEVRMLSAACASGEEAYTLSMLAAASGAFRRGSVRVMGLDLDPDALARAGAATYGEHAFRGTDDAFRERYFDSGAEGRWTVRPEYRRQVRFRRENLVRPGWSAILPPQHLVLCRNVMIYFDARGVQRCAEELYRALAPGGYLFLGHAETLREVPVPFATERRPGAVFYRRPPEDR